MALAVLSIDLVAKLASFEAGMDKAARTSERTAQRIESAFDGARNLIAGLGIAAVVASQIEGLRVAIDKLDAIDDMAEKFGIAAETLSAYGYAAEVAGTAADAFGTGIGKLSKNLADAAGGGKETGAAFAAIGVSITDANGALRGTDQVLLDVAERFASYEDGAEKAAIAQALFGKTGADMIPLLNKGREGIEALTAEAERFGLVVSGDAAAAAGEFGDTLKRLELSSQSFRQAVAIGMLPTLQALADTILAADGRTKEFNSTAGGVGLVLGEVASFVATAASGFHTFVRAIGGATAAAAAFASLDFSGAKAIARAIDEDVGAAQDKLHDFYRKSGDEYRKEMAERQRLADLVGTLADPKPTRRAAPVIGKGAGAGGGGAKGGGRGANDAEREAEAQAKAIRDNALRNEERYIAAERDLAAQRVRFLDTYNAQGLVSIKSYYDARRAITEAATSSQAAAYDREIAALRAQQAAAAKASERVTLQGQIDATLAQREKLVRDAGAAGLEMAIQQTKAEDDLRLAVAGVNAEVEQLRGNLAGVAAMRFDAANEGLRKSLTANGDTGTLARLDSLRGLTIAQAAYNEQATEAQRITEGLRIIEERIALSEKLGAISTIGALQQVGAARQEAVRQMDAIVAAQEAIARASESPALVLQAERARLALEQLQGTADTVAGHVRARFGEAAGDAFASWIDGTKSAGDAFKAFADSVIRDLSRIASQQITSGLTGKGGLLDMLFSSLRGGFGSAGPTITNPADVGYGVYANGGAFGPGGEIPFANGGIVNRATPFKFASGGALRNGVMGEAGPEGILPLQRGPGGKLGVIAHGASKGGGDVYVTVENHGARVETQETRRPDGSREVRLIIEAAKAAVAQDVRGGGEVASALQGTYGLNRGAGVMRG